MSILVGKHTRLLVQGLGKTGRFHADRSIAYGTSVVGAVHPSRAGESEVFEGEADESGAPDRAGRYRVELPIFRTVVEAMEETGANASVVFVPPAGAADAIMEAAAAGMPLIVAITEGVPVGDMIRAKRYLEGRPVRLVGPNCPGVITPLECRIGIMPGYIHQPGRIGVVSRSGTLTYEAVYQLTRLGLGQTTAVGIGGDPVNGTTFVDVLRLFNDDPATEGVIMIGEIGGTAEEDAAAFVADQMTKPVAAFIAGTTAPPGRRMGHAGAIISGGKGTAEAKIAALTEAGITIAPTPTDMGTAMQEALAATPRPRDGELVPGP
jgi:succinyl-CoA synthetase alpha subunit